MQNQKYFVSGSSEVLGGVQRRGAVQWRSPIVRGWGSWSFSVRLQGSSCFVARVDPIKLAYTQPYTLFMEHLWQYSLLLLAKSKLISGQMEFKGLSDAKW